MIENFSFLEKSFDSFKEQKSGGLFPEAVEFSDKEKTEEAREKRLKRIANDYWAFDKEYFPPAFYQDTYSKPNVMHKYIASVSDIPGIHIVFGPRKNGKSPTGRKVLIHKILTGKVKFPLVFSEDLLTASNILQDLYLLIEFNPRIKVDFRPQFIVANNDQLQLSFRLPNGDKGMCFCADFSYKRSARGMTTLFSRPDFILGDDIETLDSSFSAESVQLRREKISEAYSSCTDNTTFLIFANDFSSRSMLHLLRKLKEENLLAEHFTVAAFEAWSEKRRLDKLGDQVFTIPKGALWPDRYPAKTKNELRKMLKPMDEADWQGNFQQNPVPPEGIYFKRERYQEWNKLPEDIRSVLYTDPNLSKKGKGDTTAISGLGYSPETDKYYLTDAVCKSFADSNNLLLSILKLREKRQYLGLGFDGHVSQESSWTQHVKNFTRIHDLAFPVIEYKNYHVNDLAKNLQLIYNEGRLLFPPGFSFSEDGSAYLQQFFAFKGTKQNGVDDAPDSLICALEFIHERKIVKRQQQPVKTVEDYY